MEEADPKLQTARYGASEQAGSGRKDMLMAHRDRAGRVGGGLGLGWRGSSSWNRYLFFWTASAGYTGDERKP